MYLPTARCNKLLWYKAGPEVQFLRFSCKDEYVFGKTVSIEKSGYVCTYWQKCIINGTL